MNPPPPMAPKVSHMPAAESTAPIVNANEKRWHLDAGNHEDGLEHGGEQTAHEEGKHERHDYITLPNALTTAAITTTQTAPKLMTYPTIPTADPNPLPTVPDSLRPFTYASDTVA